MKIGIPAACVSIILGACEGRQVPNDAVVAVKFGPPSAEAEIRSVFAIKGELPDIGVMIEFAKANGIAYERSQDRSLRYCDKGRDRASLLMTIFFLGSKSSEPGKQNYVATYSKDGTVVCIETRHAYTSL